jgi:hypothetical protein
MSSLAQIPAPVTAFDRVIAGLLAAGCRVVFAGWAPSCEAPAEVGPTGPAAADDAWLAEDNARRAAAAEEMAAYREGISDAEYDEWYDCSGVAFPDWPGAEMAGATGAVYPGGDDR